MTVSTGFAACGSGDDDAELGSGGTGGTAGSAASGGSGAQGGTGGGGGSGGTAGGSAGSSGSAGFAGSDAGADADDDGAAGGAGDDGGAGAAGAAGNPGTDAGTDAPTCPDPLNEPNENENAATASDGVDDCDGQKTRAGILKPGGDQDWFKFAGTDNLLSCSPNPKVKVDKSDLRVCVFAQCQSGTTQVVCASGTAHKSPANREGCCATGGAAEITLTCSGLGSQNADLYVRVDQPNKNACIDYQLTYSY